MKRLFVLVALMTGLIPTITSAGEEQARAVLRVPDDFASIQQAVDAAQSGDTILVAAGYYCEQVVIATPDLRLRGSAGTGAERAVLSGTCFDGGYGFHVRGDSASAPVTGVEISGFAVEGFDSGIVLEYAMSSRVLLNVVRANRYRASSTPPFARGQGILLIGASSNEIAANWIHDNGHLGIGLRNGSHGNLVRGNRLRDNQAQSALGVCSLMLWGATNTGNRIVENEVTGSVGYGIMIGPMAQTGNLLAQNRVHGHSWEGIVIMPGSQFNVIQQNDARGNGLEGYTDLWDSGEMNTWLRNLGSCIPGNAGC